MSSKLVWKNLRNVFLVSFPFFGYVRAFEESLSPCFVCATQMPDLSNAIYMHKRTAKYQPEMQLLISLGFN